MKNDNHPEPVNREPGLGIIFAVMVTVLAICAFSLPSKPSKPEPTTATSCGSGNECSDAAMASANPEPMRKSVRKWDGISKDCDALPKGIEAFNCTMKRVETDPQFRREFERRLDQILNP